MKKNLFKKWVAMLGAIMLLANTTLPGLQVYADDSESSVEWELWTWSDAEWHHSDYGTYDVNVEGNTITFSNIDF